MAHDPTTTLTLIDVARTPERGGSEHVRLMTDGGLIPGRLHWTGEGDAAIIWVFGAGGGLGGPAGGLYSRLGLQFVTAGVTSLELDYRRPAHLPDCTLDVLIGIAWLEQLGKNRIVLVGHSFGGAVVINAGAMSNAVIAVAALSSQTAGTYAVDQLGPRHALFIHGTEDEVLPDRCSRHLFEAAKEPKRLILYPGCRHGLDQCRDALDRDLSAWLRQVLNLSDPAQTAPTG